jgi:low temperature requirement protein LtrA
MTDARRLFFRPKVAAEGHRVSTFELLFDLVFVFAFTHVTAFMAHSHSAIGVLEALVILVLLWWSWSAYSWLANQTRVDEGIVRLGMSIAMVAMFIVALAIPEAFVDRPGGLSGPLVLAIAYFTVRLIHGLLYLVAAGDDDDLRRQILRSSWAMFSGTALIIAGSLIGGPAQILLWTCGVAIDVVLTYFTSSGGSWRLNSASHWAERYGLVVMLALGESLVAIGTGAVNEPLSPAILLGTFLAITLTISLWWLYFDVIAIAAEHLLSKISGVTRAQMASDAYTYLHWLLIAGIVISALGVEEVIGHANSTAPLGLFAACALNGGTSLYLAGHAFFWRRVGGTWKVFRLVGASVLLALIPVGAVLQPLVALALVVVITVSVAALETKKYSAKRDQVRAIRAQ